ncbi:M10 family metallopeptidase C-terminal domain-containing protein [Bradyrhizobium sp. sBnM-33]|uniref:M10 family metallopeptidase C-terminal domain-containing protein n=1 Tax=Bradyrhizobium sp. sBnM-33 TaxID=2831780 RepID=UPI001BD0E0A4|nr:M10 family metallopeptidase C-terminal domain-containing protein [Bradyrhizobium sp. sBnM-33]
MDTTASQEKVNIIHGVAGDDTLNGTGVVDVIYGGSGNDTIEGNRGDDAVYGGSGSDTINGNDGNDTIIGGYGGDQLTGSNGDDIFVYLSAIDSNSTQFDTIIDFTLGTDKINLAALGALAFLHMTSTSTSVPPHTLAWIYNPTSNETIIYVNPTDRSLDIGDPGLLEIHLQGVVSVAESDFVYEPEAAAVAAALEGIDPALLVATASDGTVLTTGSAHASIEAEASESTLGTAGVWTMPADDGLMFHFGRDRIGSIVSTRLTSFSDDSAYAPVESNDCTVTVPVHVSSIELAHNQAIVLTEENLTLKKEPVYANTGAVATGHGKAHATAGLELFEFGMQSAAIVAPVAVAEPVETGDAPGNSAGHGNAQHASHSAAAKASAANELTEPGVTLGHGHSHPSHSASANAMGAAEPVETGDPPGNSEGHGNSQQASHSASAKASAAAELTEPGVTPGHSNSEHPSHSASASAMGAAEPVETGDAPGNGGGLDCSPQASQSAVAEPTGPDLTKGKSGGSSNWQQASHSAAPNVSAAAQPVEFGSWTGGAGHEPAFHFKNQGARSTPIEAVELEQLNDWPVLLGHAGDLVAIRQVGPAATEEHAASHVNNGQHHAIGHLPHELLI